MGDRIKFSLGELAAEGRSVISGPFGSDIGTQFFKSEGIPVIRGNNLTTDHLKFVDNGFVFVTEAKADDLAAYAVQDDLIFTAAGTIGQVGMIPKGSKFEKYVISNKQIRFRADQGKVDLDYLYAWLSSPWIFKAIRDRDTGSTVPLINLSVVRSLPVSFPKSVTEQTKIGRIFRTIDAKIDLNNRINAELEALAKAIYDYWFVQFDFPDTNGRPYKSSGGAMVWNDALKREIPAGWSTRSLEQIISRSGTGLNPRDNFELGKGSNYYVTIKNVNDGRIILDDKCDRIDDEALKIIDRRSQLQPGDVLFTSIEPVGITYLIREKPTNWNINESVFTIRPDSEVISSEFLFFLLSSKEMKAFTKNSSAGSIHKGIRHAVLKSFELPYGGKPLLDDFSELVRPMLQKLHLLDVETRELTRLRDWLLPLLMTGQVRVA